MEWRLGNYYYRVIDFFRKTLEVRSEYCLLINCTSGVVVLEWITTHNCMGGKSIVFYLLLFVTASSGGVQFVDVAETGALIIILLPASKRR